MSEEICAKLLTVPTKVYLSKFISAYEKVRINYVRTLLA